MIRFFVLIFTVVTGFGSASYAEISRFSIDPSLQKQGNIIQMSIILDVPISQAWDLVGTNFDKTKLFNVEAASTKYLRGDKAKVGTRRRTLGTNGTFIDVEIFRYSKAKRIVSWEIIATDLAPISFGFSEYRLQAIDDRSTRLVQVSGFKMKRALMDAAMRLRFPTILKTELAGIKLYLETGEIIRPNSARLTRNRFGSEITVKKNW
jgi:hypothetical protein